MLSNWFWCCMVHLCTAYVKIPLSGPEYFDVLLFSAGVLRVWDSSSARCVFTQTLPDAPTLNTEEGDLDPRSLMHLLPMPQSNRLVTVTAEHNILIYQMPTLTVQQQVSLSIHLPPTVDISWTQYISESGTIGLVFLFLWSLSATMMISWMWSSWGRMTHI